MYSLFDGSEVVSMDKMHTQYIFAFLVTRSGKQIISAGKDSKIKIWDWVKQTLKTTLLFHSDCVESIALSGDENLLFTSGCDGKIGVWSMQNYLQICHLITDYPVRSLYLSD
mmetsp:Transcript_21643/g.15894  ORF Transcript_21643/g.15894 Transcript_21643/m.15894 type:complete len:112 (+) Transcript_21643:834-1169(+)